jgi:hypothetical protein
LRALSVITVLIRKITTTVDELLKAPIAEVVEDIGLPIPPQSMSDA